MIEFLLVLVVRPLLGAGGGGVPPGATLSLNSRLSGRFWFHVLLDVYDTVRGDICGESPCAVSKI